LPSNIQGSGSTETRTNSTSPEKSSGSLQRMEAGLSTLLTFVLLAYLSR
jgi:hypothetical protein